MSGMDIDLRDLTVDFGSLRAVNQVTTHIPANSITGLLGRNGSGKTTLLSTLASLRRPSAGSVKVDGRDPFEDEYLMERICLIREGGDTFPDEKVSATLAFVATARPTWDQAYAEELLEIFQIDPSKKPTALSRGTRSALGAVIGLASRTPVTIFDEVYLGMDAPTRRRFYDLLLADYVHHPRTMILSSHLISEIEQLLEQVIILDEGRMVMDGDADHVRRGGATITGSAADVEAATAGWPVLSRRDLGPTTEVTIHAELDAPARRQLQDSGLEVGAVPLEDLFIAVTNQDQKETQS